MWHSSGKWRGSGGRQIWCGMLTLLSMDVRYWQRNTISLALSVLISKMRIIRPTLQVLLWWGLNAMTCAEHRADMPLWELPPFPSQSLHYLYVESSIRAVLPFPSSSTWLKLASFFFFVCLFFPSLNSINSFFYSVIRRTRIFLVLCRCWRHKVEESRHCLPLELHAHSQDRQRPTGLY